MKKEIENEERLIQTENIPSCFEKTYCHIRRLLKNPIYNSKTMMQCDGCVHDNLNNYPDNFIGAVKKII